MVDSAVDSLPLVTRTLSAVVGGNNTRTLGLSRVLDAPIDTVWGAFSFDRIQRWFAPVSGDARLGGRYQVEGNAGGEIVTCDAPTSIAVTWEYGGDISHVRIELSELPSGGTQFVFEHTADVDPERWAEYGPGAVGVGWDMGLLGLARHVEHGYDTPIETPDWMTSADAKAFAAGSSDLWAEAAIASGDEPEAVRAAAARTTAAYTA